MIKGQILKKAQQKIKEKNKQAENLASFHLEEMLSVPKFKKIYTQIKTAEIENAKCQALGEKEKHNLKALYKQLEDVLSKYGKPKNYLCIKHFCKLCNDKGYKDEEMCICLKDEINNILLELSGIKHKLYSFEDAKPTTPENKIIFEKMQQWCNKNSKIKNIVFVGYTGTGKTYLMECMANQLIKNGNVICWTTAFNLNQNLLAYHTSQDKNRSNFIDTFINADCLFIDDLGTEPILNKVTIEGIYLILSERMEKNLPTIISTNLDLGQIEETYGERIFSRLLYKEKSLTLEIKNEDLRLKKQ